VTYRQDDKFFGDRGQGKLIDSPIFDVEDLHLRRKTHRYEEKRR